VTVRAGQVARKGFHLRYVGDTRESQAAGLIKDRYDLPDSRTSVRASLQIKPGGGTGALTTNWGTNES